MLATILLSVVLSTSVESPKLIGGYPYEGAAPSWLVRLDGEVGPCSGFLVAPAWVVTAAHCDRAAEVARVGISHLEDPIEEHQVVEWIVHPQWDYFRQHDLALVRIYPPAWDVTTLDIAKTKPPIGPFEGTIGGWGNYKWDPDNINIDVDSPRWKEVGEIVECEHFLDDPAICLTIEKASVCHGDSGSPLLGDDGLAYGVAVRIEDGRCGLGTLTTYTDLTAPVHRDWVYQTISGGIKANFEWPGPDPEGIGLAGGWAFSPEIGIKPLVELWINGNYSISMPCCSDRADVPAVFSGAPLRSGFAGIFNWGALLPPGDHSLRAIVDDTQGNRKILEKDISIQEDQ